MKCILTVEPSRKVKMSMRWPTLSDYHEAIQIPATCFLDPELKVGIVATTYYRTTMTGQCAWWTHA